jgi:hypothetical protein
VSYFSSIFDQIDYLDLVFVAVNRSDVPRGTISVFKISDLDQVRLSKCHITLTTFRRSPSRKQVAKTAAYIRRTAKGTMSASLESNVPFESEPPNLETIEDSGVPALDQDTVVRQRGRQRGRPRGRG